MKYAVIRCTVEDLLPASFVNYYDDFAVAKAEYLSAKKLIEAGGTEIEDVYLVADIAPYGIPVDPDVLARVNMSEQLRMEALLLEWKAKARRAQAKLKVNRAIAARIAWQNYLAQDGDK